MQIDTEIAKAVVKVGDGRGFIVEASHNRLVITAAHCLPHFPPCHGGSYLNERTYRNLLGPLGDSERTVWAECLFADPVGDIAVLGSPDGQELYDEAEVYEALTHGVPTLRVGNGPQEGPAWVLMLDGRWVRCTAKHFGGPLWIENATEGIHGGMSGSPILTDHATAIGVVCISSGIGDTHHTGGGPNPRLTHHLPGWLLREFACA